MDILVKLGVILFFAIPIIFLSGLLIATIYVMIVFTIELITGKAWAPGSHPFSLIKYLFKKDD